MLALCYQAQGLRTRAKETAHALLAGVQQEHNRVQLMMAYVFCGQLALLQNEVEVAQQWLDLVGEQAVTGPMFFFDEPPVRARLLLARGDEASVAQGQSLLRHFLPQVEAIHNVRKTISVLALQAWAYELQGRRSEARDYNWQ
jgi:hypothetical protein